MKMSVFEKVLGFLVMARIFHCIIFMKEIGNEKFYIQLSKASAVCSVVFSS